jgi:hypothetical protein
VNFFLQSLIAFLPRQYRKVVLRGGEVSPGPAIASGVAQVLVCFDLLVRYYFAFANQLLRTVPDQVTYGAYSSSGEPGLMGIGVLLLSFVLQPLTIPLAYLVCEGASRILGAVLMGEIRGSLVLWLVAVGQARVEAWREEKKLGARVADEVAATDEGLRIASCRAKVDWDEWVTISHRQVLYEVAAQEVGVPPRPFVYLLRPKPEFKVIRGLRHYSPEEGLKGQEPHVPSGLVSAAPLQ